MNLWSSVALAINLETMAPGSFGLSEFYVELGWNVVTPSGLSALMSPHHHRPHLWNRNSAKLIDSDPVTEWNLL